MNDLSRRTACRVAILPALAMFCIFSGGVGQTNANESSPAHQFCQMTSASDPAGFQTCVNQQIQGAQSIVRYMKWSQETGGPAGERVLQVMEFCRDRWMPDHHMTDNCLRARALIPPP